MKAQATLLEIFTLEEIEAIARSLKHEVEGIEAAAQWAESRGIRVEEWERQKQSALSALAKLK